MDLAKTERVSLLRARLKLIVKSDTSQSSCTYPTYLGLRKSCLMDVQPPRPTPSEQVGFPAASPVVS